MHKVTALLMCSVIFVEQGTQIRSCPDGDGNRVHQSAYENSGVGGVYEGGCVGAVSSPHEQHEEEEVKNMVGVVKTEEGPSAL